MEVQIKDRVAEVELLEKNENSVRLSLDGKPYEVDRVLTDIGVCSILYNGRSYNMEVVREKNGKTYKVNRRFESYEVEIIDAQARYLRARKKDDVRQENDLTAPMPGKVVQLMVEVGTELKGGDTVVVFEAMKMQSSLKVTADCVVREIFVQEGDSVASGQLLVRLDVVETNKEENDEK